MVADLESVKYDARYNVHFPAFFHHVLVGAFRQTVRLVFDIIARSLRR